MKLYPLERCSRCLAVLITRPDLHRCDYQPLDPRGVAPPTPKSFLRMVAAFVEFVDATQAYDDDQRGSRK